MMKRVHWVVRSGVALLLGVLGISAAPWFDLAGAQGMHAPGPDRAVVDSSTGSVGAVDQLRLDHLGLLVTDLARSVAFYHDVLGLNEITTNYPGTRWLGVVPGLQIHLIPGRTSPVADTDSHFAFTTADLAPVVARLNAHHVDWDDGDGHAGQIAKARADGVWQIYLRDPDGYEIEINDASRKR